MAQVEEGAEEDMEMVAEGDADAIIEMDSDDSLPPVKKRKSMMIEKKAPKKATEEDGGDDYGLALVNGWVPPHFIFRWEDEMNKDYVVL